MMMLDRLSGTRSLCLTIALASTISACGTSSSNGGSPSAAGGGGAGGAGGGGAGGAGGMGAGGMGTGGMAGTTPNVPMGGGPATGGMGGSGGVAATGGSGGADAAVDAGDAGGAGGEPQPPTKLSCTPMGEVPQLKKTRIAAGLNDPTELIGLPDEDDVLWVLEHQPQGDDDLGHIKAVVGGSTIEQSVATVELSGRYDGKEEGLLSIALHPDFAGNKLFYVYYAGREPNIGENTVDEFRKTSATSAEFVRNVYHANSDHHFHSGGQLGFGPTDGELYLSVGDNNENGGPDEAQKPEGIWGRILKIDRDARTATTVHYGLRHPYRFSFDPQTSDMYIADVGNSGDRSEKLFFVAAGETGRNFGWRGSDDREDQTYLDEIASDGGAVIGGFVYRGSKMPGLCGRYFYGNYGTGGVWSIQAQANGEGTAKSDHDGALDTGSISSFGIDAKGELYIISLSGTIDRIDPAD